jgi:hypothetical protein
MKNFIDILLCNDRPGRSGIGIFGQCIAYYGMVEAQGRGTLHCHMLIWLVGHLSLEALQSKMETDPLFKNRLFQWLESIICCQLLDMMDVVVETNGPLPPPPRQVPHPTTLNAPSLDSEDFPNDYIIYVNSLVIAFNWHEHTHTCWKYLKPGDAKVDANCQMRIDGSTIAQTYLDENHSIKLKRLHPRISNYNDIITFCMKCNNDIKFIGSGEDAKALIYYMTDYITKLSLPFHIAMPAFSFAIQKWSSSLQSLQGKELSLLNKCLNSLNGQLEFSHQQIMNYLVGNGDVYTNETFRVLWLGSFDRVTRAWLQGTNDNGQTFCDYKDEIEDDECTGDDKANLSLTEEGVSASNQFLDYTLRSDHPAFSNLSLYDFISNTYKITVKEEQKHTSERSDSRRGRPANTQGTFLPDHPQYATHLLRKHTSPFIPVLLGPTIPKKDTSNEKWCKLMLILFRPWRDLNDLMQGKRT